MKKGRELDAEICEVVFGWTECFKVPPDADGENSGMILAPNPEYKKEWIFPPKGKVGRAYFCPDYSNNFYDTLALAKHVGLSMAAKDLPNTPEAIAVLCLEHYRQNYVVRG